MNTTNQQQTAAALKIIATEGNGTKNKGPFTAGYIAGLRAGYAMVRSHKFDMLSDEIAKLCEPCTMSTRGEAYLLALEFCERAISEATKAQAA